jgi:hypothetical protein
MLCHPRTSSARRPQRRTPSTPRHSSNFSSGSQKIGLLTRPARRIPVTRALLLTAVTTAIAIGTACSNDRAINSICGFPQPGFDIEEASTLQDGQGYAGMHDAVVLTFEEAIDLPASSSWRVRSVEIMPLINQFEFDFYPDGSWVTVEVWDGDDPTQTEPWRVSQQFFKTEHEWTAVTLNDPTTAFPGTHMQTWWRGQYQLLGGSQLGYQWCTTARLQQLQQFLFRQLDRLQRRCGLGAQRDQQPRRQLQLAHAESQPRSSRTERRMRRRTLLLRIAATLEIDRSCTSRGAVQCSHRV